MNIYYFIIPEYPIDANGQLKISVLAESKEDAILYIKKKYVNSSWINKLDELFVGVHKQGEVICSRGRSILN